VDLKRSEDGMPVSLEADEVISATGFTCPLGDLPALGVATFGQSRLPAQTPFWESATVPGIYFAGTITQGSKGLRKHGIPSNSGAVQGHRYNGRILARHIGEKHFGLAPERRPVGLAELRDYMLAEASRGPELWHQKAYLCRAVSIDPAAGLVDEGILPLTHFLDREGSPDGVAMTVEADEEGRIFPVVYVRRDGSQDEHVLDPHPLHDFETNAYRDRVGAILDLVAPGASVG
jgi:hypothetical protein